MSTEASGGEESGNILVDAVASDAAPQEVAADNATAEAVVAQMGVETLALQDMLRDVQSDANADGLGAYLSLESVGNSTVVLMDADSAGPAAPIAIATLDNVTGVTLQQLLSSNEIQS